MTKLAINKLWNKFKRTKNNVYKHAHHRLSKTVQQMVKRDRANFENKIANDSDAKRFYKYVRSSLNRPCKIPPLIDENGVKYVDNTDKCNLLNEYLVSVFSTDDGVLPNFPIRTNKTIENIQFTHLNVLSALKKVSNSFSSGPDRLPAIFVKSVADAIIEPLCTLFNVCFYSSAMPNDWSDANVVPIFKNKGSSSSPKNYRPISLTSVISKVMEHVIKSQLMDHLLTNNLLSDKQHGFLARRSTLTQLVFCVNEWVTDLENGLVTDVVYFDLAKAFDSVVHSKLVHKCKSYGCKGLLLEFINTYLCNRRQRVNIDGCHSNYGDVSSGIPQGTVDGPLYFDMFFNDATNSVNESQIMLYADDTKLYKSFQKSEGYSAHLQDDIDSFNAWTQSWQLKIHADKSFVLPLGFRRDTDLSNYCINNVQLPVVTHMKDLGITIDQNLNFSMHCSNIAKSASSRVGLIFRGFSSRSLNFLVKMFINRVRPVLEYNCEVWSPHMLKDIDLLEGVQRSYTKRISGIEHLPYSERLKICKLESLELRRLKRDLIFVYKIVYNLVDLKFEDFFELNPSTRTRGNSKKLYPKKARTSRCLFSFAFRVVNPWNNLPNDVVQSCSLSVFGLWRPLGRTSEKYEIIINLFTHLIQNITELSQKSNCTRPPKYNSNVVRKDSQHPQRTGLLQTPRAQNGKNLTQSLNRWNRITPMTTQYNNGQSSFGCSSDVGRTYVDVLNGVNVVCTAV